MANYYTWDGKCPHCKKEHEIDFCMYNPSDGDEDVEGVTCDCGCIFEVHCYAEVDISLYCNLPIVIKEPNSSLDDEEYHSNDPNQLNLL